MHACFLSCLCRFTWCQRAVIAVLDAFSEVMQDVFTVQKTVESVMTDLHGMIMPIQVLSNISVASEYDVLSSNCQDDLLNRSQPSNSCSTSSPTPESLWLPFSPLFSHYLSTSRYKQPPCTCEFSWPQSKSFKVRLTPAPAGMSYSKNCGVRGHLKGNNHFLANKECHKKWSKFVVQGVICKTFYKLPDALFLCHPQSLDMVQEDCLAYCKTLKKLCCQNQYLVLHCETTCGNKALGLLSAFSLLSGVISIYGLPSSALINENGLYETKHIKMEENSKDEVEETVKQLTEELICQTEDSDYFEKVFGAHILKPSPVESMENWLASACITPKINIGINSNGCWRRNSSVAYHSNLLDGYNKEEKWEYQKVSVSSSPRRSPRLKLSRRSFSPVVAESKDNVMNSSSSSSVTVQPSSEEQVLSHCQMQYQLAMKQPKVLFSSAHSIVTDVLLFLRSKKANVVKQDLLSFMADKILLTPEMLLQMYDGKIDMESLDKRTKEYQIQIFLHLEIEAAFPSLPVNRCSETIIVFLKGMIAAAGRAQVAQFLRECIRENYRHSLHHVLKGIEYEVGISFLRRSSPLSSVSFLSPESSTQSSAMSLSSVASHKSSSSQREYRWKKLSASQSIFSGSISKKQISLSQGYVKKQHNQKASTGQFAGCRKSPRLVNLNLQFGDLSPRAKRARVRRNLFVTAFRSPERRRKTLPAAKTLKRVSPKSKALAFRKNQKCNNKITASTPPQHSRTRVDAAHCKKPSLTQSTCEDLSSSLLLSSGDLKDKEAVISTISKLHESAVKEHKPLLSAARSIVNTVLLFLKSQKEAVGKEELVSLMQETVMLTPKSITELYEGEMNQHMQVEKAREYEIQVLFNLEVEAAFSSLPSSENCVNVVVSLLRGMLFAAGHGKVSQFLQDSIRENYCHNLHHILLDIEEELGVSIVGKSEESTPQKDTSPEPQNKSFKSMLSFQSTSSAASVAEEQGFAKKASANQRTFSADFHNRQIMVPSELLKKQKPKKHKAEPAIAVKHSPRMDVKKKRTASSALSPNPKRIRRNLFNCPSSAKTAESSSHISRNPHAPRKQSLTPRGHHILKTTFVPETPLHRQGHSSVRNRQYRLRKISGTLSSKIEEVAESPVTNRHEDKEGSGVSHLSSSATHIRSAVKMKNTKKKTKLSAPQQKSSRMSRSATVTSSSSASSDLGNSCRKNLFPQNIPMQNGNKWKHLQAKRGEISAKKVDNKTTNHTTPLKNKALFPNTTGTPQTAVIERENSAGDSVPSNSGSLSSSSTYTNDVPSSPVLFSDELVGDTTTPIKLKKDASTTSKASIVSNDFSSGNSTMHSLHIKQDGKGQNSSAESYKPPIKRLAKRKCSSTATVQTRRYSLRSSGSIYTNTDMVDLQHTASLPKNNSCTSRIPLNASASVSSSGNSLEQTTSSDSPENLEVSLSDQLILKSIREEKSLTNPVQWSWNCEPHATHLEQNVTANQKQKPNSFNDDPCEDVCESTCDAQTQSPKPRHFINMYKPPTPMSLMHLTNSPVAFIQKGRKSHFSANKCIQ